MLKVKKIKNRGKRTLSYISNKNLKSSQKPFKPLTKKLRKNSGRMRKGRISISSRGGGADRRYRLIDFKQRKEGKLVIERIEKDPNRSCFIALANFPDNKKCYILATKNLKPGLEIETGDKAEIKEGNRTVLKRIPTGTAVSNIELNVNSGGQLARSGGSYAVLMGCEDGLAQLKMPSGEIRLVNEKCYANIGQMSNIENNAVRIGKAGRKRHMRKRPHVRGKAKNPVDHPHGGGEGNQSIGMKHPKTPWGKPALGVKTRKKNKYSDKLILKRRKKKR